MHSIVGAQSMKTSLSQAYSGLFYFCAFWSSPFFLGAFHLLKAYGLKESFGLVQRHLGSKWRKRTDACSHTQRTFQTTLTHTNSQDKGFHCCLNTNFSTGSLKIALRTSLQTSTSHPHSAPDLSISSLLSASQFPNLYIRGLAMMSSECPQQRLLGFWTILECCSMNRS